MDKKLAEFVGIMFGDGSLGIYRSVVNNKEKTQYRIKISLNSIKDLKYSEYVSKLVERIFNKTLIIRKRKGENTVDIYLLGKKHTHFLLNIGLVLAPKWNRAVIPKKFMESSLSKFVLRGYMDTDGCVCNVNNNGVRYPRIEMKICPSPMQVQLINILRFHGFEPKIYSIEKGKIRVVLHGVKNLRKWCEIIGFSNERNIKIASRFINVDSKSI